MVVPAPAIHRLRSGLRTQATNDVTVADLARLGLIVSGTTLGADQYRFTGVSYDANGQLVANLTVDVPLNPGTILTLRTASGNFALKLVIPANATGGAQIDVNSSARALIAERLAAKGQTVEPDSIPAASITLIADRLANLLTSTGSTDVLTADILVKTITRVVDVVITGNGDDADVIALIRKDTNRSDPDSSGGGGGGAATPSLAGTVTLGGGVLGKRALVQISNKSDGTVIAKTATDTSGRYAFYGIPDGTYILTVAVDGAVQQSREITLPYVNDN